MINREPRAAAANPRSNRVPNRSSDRCSDSNRRTDLLAAAFGDRPEATVGVDGPRGDRWLAAVVLGGQGRYARAATVLGPLLRGTDPVLGALAGATLGSHLRQLGGHAAARGVDSAALCRLTSAPPRSWTEPDGPHGVGRRAALVDVLLGLAADAIGLGATDEAARLHESAVRASRRGPAGADVPWRVTVRIDWVAAELALATDRPNVAFDRAVRARAVATASGAVRHATKSIMVAGAAAASGGTPDGRRRAEGLLTEALAASLTRGMVPLVWPSALLLAELVPDRRPEFVALASSALNSILVACTSEMRRIVLASPWMPGRLIRSGEPPRTGVELST